MEIGCACVCDYYESAEVSSTKMVKARKEHTCCECRETIKKGELYENATGLWDGSWDRFKTCWICLRIREDVCSCGWVYGELRETIWEHFGVDYVTGKIWNEDDGLL